MYSASDYRGMARRALKNYWWLAVGVTLLASILGGTSSGFTPSFNITINGDDLTQYYPETLRHALRVFLPVSGIISLVQFVIGGSVSIGHNRFCLKLVDGEQAQFEDLFSGFDNLHHVDEFCRIYIFRIAILRPITGEYFSQFAVFIQNNGVALLDVPVIQHLILLADARFCSVFIFQNNNCHDRLVGTALLTAEIKVFLNSHYLIFHKNALSSNIIHAFLYSTRFLLLQNFLFLNRKNHNPLPAVPARKQIHTVDLIEKFQFRHSHQIRDIGIRRVIEKQLDLPRIFVVRFQQSCHRFS